MNFTKKLLIVTFFLGLFCSLFIFPVFPAWADCEPGKLLPPCTCSGNCKLTDFLALGSRLVQYGIGILSVITLGFIIYGGISFLMAMGSPEKIEAGKKILGGTIRGVAIILLAWTIVNTVIFFLTGNTSGLLFGGTGEPWWKFKETSLSEMYENSGDEFCPFRRTMKEGVVQKDPQECTDTIDKGWDTDEEKHDHYCRSLGVCEGPKSILCCDILWQGPLP